MTIAALVITPLAFWYVSRSLGTEPYWFLAVAVCVPLAVVLMQKWPVILLTGLMFVGNFKNAPAQGVTFTDPTMILLLLCAGAVMLNILYVLSGIYGWTLRNLLAGQGVKVVLFVLFTAVLVASLIYTADPQYGKLKVSRFVTFEILAFVAPLILLRNSEHLRQFVITSTLLSVGLVVRDLLQLIYASAGVLKGDADITRIGDSMLFGLSILIILYHGVGRSRLVNYAVVAILAVGMITSVARGPIAALLITILMNACAVHSVGHMISRKRLLIGTAVVAVVGFAALQWVESLPWARDRVAWKQAELVSLLEGTSTSAGTVSARLSFNASAIEAAEQHPLLGLGVGGWGVFYSPEVWVRFPHNFILEVAAEQGLLGFTLLVMLLVMLFRSAYSLLGCKGLAFLFPVLTFIVIYNMMTGDIENRQLWFWFGMVAASSRMALVSSAANVDVYDKADAQAHCCA